MRSRPRAVHGAVLDLDRHGVDGDHRTRLHSLVGLSFEHLGLLLGLGQARAVDLLGPAAVGSEIDDDAVDQTIGGDDVRHA
jgi:hypothetical protein